MEANRRTGKWPAIALIVCAIVAAVAYKANLNADRRARFAERDIKNKAACELASEITDRIILAFETHMDFDTFERKFGPLAEYTGGLESSRMEPTHVYVHDKTQCTLYLRFEDGHLMGIKSGNNQIQMDTAVVLETPAFHKSESVRLGILSFAKLAWLVALVGWIFVERFRRPMPTGLIVLSILCGICWFLAPNYSPTWRGIMGNDNLAFFLLMLIIALVFRVQSGTTPGGPHHGPGNCRMAEVS